MDPVEKSGSHLQFVKCPVCQSRQSTYMALALHMMRGGENNFIQHSEYVQHLTSKTYTVFIRESRYLKTLAALLEKTMS